MARPNRTLWIMAAVLVFTSAAVTLDLAGPIRSDIRLFDGEAIARVDAAMWRSYYDRRPVPLFLQLAEVLRRQFHVPFLRSFVIAARGARAAFVFKGGHGKDEYERALPDLRRYFQSIRDLSRTPFDVDRATRLELDWWIAHRARVAEDSLARALDAAAGELYRVAPERLEPYGIERARAMILRDGRDTDGRVSEHDWEVIRGHLRVAWNGLERALAAAPTAAAGGAAR